MATGTMQVLIRPVLRAGDAAVSWFGFGRARMAFRLQQSGYRPHTIQGREVWVSDRGAMTFGTLEESLPALIESAKLMVEYREVYEEAARLMPPHD